MYVYLPPGLDISNNSALHATVPSPLAHLLIDYKNLRSAQLRRSHADAWYASRTLFVYSMYT